MLVIFVQVLPLLIENSQRIIDPEYPERVSVPVLAVTQTATSADSVPAMVGGSTVIFTVSFESAQTPFDIVHMS